MQLTLKGLHNLYHGMNLGLLMFFFFFKPFVFSQEVKFKCNFFPHSIRNVLYVRLKLIDILPLVIFVNTP